MKYKIYTRENEYLGDVECDETRMETVGSQTPEGFFRSDEIPETEQFGERTVFALVA